MKNRFSFLIAPAIVFCWCLFSLQACKDPILENTNLLTGNDTLNLAKDTMTLTVSSLAEKPLVSNGASVGALGNMYDANFGYTYGSFYAQFPLTTNGIFFGINPTLDSVVLTLAYNGLYGPCTNPIDVAVYELNQDLSSSATYYTNSSFPVNTPALGQLTGFVANVVDSVTVGGTNIAPHIRIRLSDTFGKKILLADASVLQDAAAFLSYFKGLYVTSTQASTGNGMMYINFPSGLTGINLYYHYYLTDTSTNATAGSYTLPVSGVTLNHFDNLNAGTPAYTATQPHTGTDEKIYVQGGAASKGKIKIELDSIVKKAGINKAELIVTQSPGDTAFPVPSSLNLLRLDDAGNGQLLEDISSSSFGGIKETVTVNGETVTRYRFNITRYFQKLVQGIYNNNGLFISISTPYTSVERIVLANSSTNKNYQISLTVTYTKL